MKWPSKKQKSVAVLGCGPAGLFAAHALEENGWQVWLFSKARKSHLFGAQYLHSPIPGLTPDGAESIQVEYRLTGTAEKYRQKIYGALPVNVSVEALDTRHQAWDIRATYDKAWELYGGRVHDVDLSDRWLMANGSQYDLVVNTIPLPTVCHEKDSHQFHAVNVWALGDAPERGQQVPLVIDRNTVECNGTEDTAWYRASNVYGYSTIEWPVTRKPPLPGVAEVIKPLYTDCDCFRRREYGFKFLPLGRYGQWQKGVLSHHAYTQAAQV